MAKPNYKAKGSDITKDNWRIIATNRKWNQLSRNEKAPFYEQVWNGEYKTVQWSDEEKAEKNFTEWKTTLSQENIERVDKYRQDVLSDYVYNKSWDNVNYIDKRLFPGGEAEFNDWQKEASRYISPSPNFGTPPWYKKLLEEYAANRTPEQIAAAEAEKAKKEQERLDYLKQFAPAENSSAKATATSQQALTNSEPNQMSKIADAKNKTEAKNLALEDNKITAKEAKDLKAKGVSLEKIEELKQQANDALVKELRIKALSDGKLSNHEIKQLKEAGVPQSKIDKMKDNLTPINIPGIDESSFTNIDKSSGAGLAERVDQLTDAGVGPLSPALMQITEIKKDDGVVDKEDVEKIQDLYGGQNAIAAMPNIDDLSISKDAKQSILDALGIEDMSFKEFVEKSGSSTVITNEEGDTVFNFLPEEKGFFDKKLDAAGLDAAYNEYSASQLLKFYNDGDLKIGKNALASIKAQADEDEGKVEIGGYGRIGEGRFTDRPAADPENNTGVFYKTYNTGGDDKFLKIGNLRGHRYEGSPYKDIKIVDYDASIANYDPSREGSSTSSFVTDFKKHSRKPTFKDFEVKALPGTKMGDIRTEERVKDYQKRGLITDPDNPNRITKAATVKTYKTLKDGKVSYVPLKTDDRGNLKQLSFDGSVSTAKFPKELSDADSWSAGIGKETSFFDKVNTKASARNSLATIASTKSKGRAFLQGIANN